MRSSSTMDCQRIIGIQRVMVDGIRASNLSNSRKLNGVGGRCVIGISSQVQVSDSHRIQRG